MGLYRPTYTDAKGKRRHASLYWLSYRRNGIRIRESAETDNLEEAKRILAVRQGDVARGVPISNRTNQATVGELCQDVLLDYEVNGKKSIDATRRRTRLHLAPFFGNTKASKVSTENLARYIAGRQREKASNASINRELAILKRGFNLGYAATPQKVLRVPKSPPAWPSGTCEPGSSRIISSPPCSPTCPPVSTESSASHTRQDGAEARSWDSSGDKWTRTPGRYA